MAPERKLSSALGMAQTTQPLSLGGLIYQMGLCLPMRAAVKTLERTLGTVPSAGFGVPLQGRICGSGT